jgi:hypothetical protein
MLTPDGVRERKQNGRHCIGAGVKYTAKDCFYKTEEVNY